MIFQSPSGVVKLVPKWIISKSRNLSTELPIITQEVNNNALIILNRPKSLNAQNYQFHVELEKTLKNLENKKSTVILRGAGDKAFSAGGDLLAIKQTAKLNNTTRLLQMIYNLHCNIYRIYRYKIPIVALMNGIAFGGGAGCAIFARYRIATEKTKFGMPEVRIAFHPNAAGTYFLNRTPGKLGYYLGLTGNSLNGADVLHAGYATHYCKSPNLVKLEEELLNCTEKDDIADIIEHFCEQNVPEFSLRSVMEDINDCFSKETVEDIILKLKETGSPWAMKTVDMINRYSPTSLKVILRQLQKGKDMDVKDCLAMESNLSLNFYKYTDCYEGTRITLEDKNGTPKWNPSKLSDVTDELVEEHFRPTVEDGIRPLLNEIDSK